MSRDKQISKMVNDVLNSSILSIEDATDVAKSLYNRGYRKADEVAREVAYDFQNRLRHIFLGMCDYNDYNTLNLLQIDSAIEALYDTFIAELKKKYTEEGK